jgi:hypothetical protein
VVPSRIPNPNPDALTDSDPTNDTIADPLDTPPITVILVETCTATYGGQYFVPGGSGGGACDNGLGFGEVAFTSPMYMYEAADPDGGGGTQTLIGYTFHGESKGTRYTKRAGGQTIQVTCSPLANAYAINGMCEASVSYSCSIIVPTVSLAGTTRFYDPHAIKFITGQRISATISPAGGGAPPASPDMGGGLSIDPSSYSWSLTGDFDPFKDFTYGSIGQRKEWLATDYKQAAFNFYANRQDSGKVLCDFKYVLPPGAKFAGGLPNFTAESREIDSVRPVLNDWEVRTGAVSLTISDFVFGAGGIANNGQQWLNVKVDLAQPFGDVGTAAFCQLINADRHLYRTTTIQNQPTHFIKDPHNKVEATIDMGFPYPHGATWSIQNEGTGHDSPRQPLAYSWPYTHIWHNSTASDSFQTYVMYRPPAQGGQPTTWIPIARYTWTWKGAAERTFANGIWSAYSLDPGSRGTVTSAPRCTEIHPFWNKTSPSPFGFKPISP